MHDPEKQRIREDYRFFTEWISKLEKIPYAKMAMHPEIRPIMEQNIRNPTEKRIKRMFLDYRRDKNPPTAPLELLYAIKKVWATTIERIPKEVPKDPEAIAAEERNRKLFAQMEELERRNTRDNNYIRMLEEKVELLEKELEKCKKEK